MRHKWLEQKRSSSSPESRVRSIEWRHPLRTVISFMRRTYFFTLFTKHHQLLTAAHTINLMSPGCQGCVSKCSYDYGCVRLSVSADWRRLIPIRDDCDPCDIIVPDVNHLTTSNQEVHPVIDPGPTVRWPRLVQHSQILAAKYFRQTQLNISARRVFNTFSIKCRNQHRAGGSRENKRQI